MPDILHLIKKTVTFFFSKIKPQNETKELFGSISIEDEVGIKKAIELAEKFDGPVIEIGVLFGHTTNLIATFAEKTKKIIAVDNFKWNPFGLSQEIHKQFTERTLRYIIQNRNTELFPADSATFFESYKGPTPSMIFIDADHSYEAVKKEILSALRVGIQVISGHDFSNQHIDVQKAVKEIFGNKFEVFGTVWIAKLSDAIV